MGGGESPVTLLTLLTLVTLMTLMWAAVSGQQPGLSVSCDYMSSQVLPCSFPSGADLLVHWMKEPTRDPVVHSYYNGRDQLDHQLLQFRGRTSLFLDQLPQGNASLLLRQVRVSDRGRYRCYTSNTRVRQNAFVNLEVQAPVSQVSIAEEGERITCRSQGIYPRPRVTWAGNQSADTRVEQTEQQLYNVSSSIPRSEGAASVTCQVRSLWSSRSATLTSAGHLQVTGSEESLACPALEPPLMSISWSFNGSLIARREDLLQVKERWRDHVKDLSRTGSLSLQKLAPHLSGVYSCEVVTAEETQVKVVRLSIAAGRESGASSWIRIVALVVSGLVVLVVLVALVVFLCKRQAGGGAGDGAGGAGNPAEMLPLDGSGMASGTEEKQDS